MATTAPRHSSLWPPSPEADSAHPSPDDHEPTPTGTAGGPFLGYEIRAQHSDTKITRSRRAVNGAIGLFVPKAVIRQRCALYMNKGKPAQRGALLHDDDFTIVAKYGAEYAGLVQYYRLAQDVFRLGRLRWVMETSILKTLAGKHRSTVTKMARRYKTTIETPTGPRTVFQVTVERDRGKKPLLARFGGIQLRRARTTVLTDQRPVMASTRRNELIHRLLAGRCEICENTVDLEVHHIRRLADLNKPGRGHPKHGQHQQPDGWYSKTPTGCEYEPFEMEMGAFEATRWPVRIYRKDAMPVLRTVSGM